MSIGSIRVFCSGAVLLFTLLTSWGAGAQEPVVSADAVLPDTPPGMISREWFEVMDDGEPEDLEAFFRRRFAEPGRSYDPEDDLANHLMVFRNTGGVRPAAVIRSTPLEIVVLGEGRTGEWIRVRIRVDETSPGIVSELAIRKSSGPESVGRSLVRWNAAQLREVARAAADTLAAGYVDPQVAVRYAQVLRAMADSLEGDRTGEAFAAEALRRLSEVERNGHLRFLDPGRAERILGELGVEEAAHSEEGPGDLDARSPAETPGEHGEGPALEQANVRLTSLGDGAFELFVPDFRSGHMEEELTSLLATVPSDARLLVVDLRENGGGDGEVADLLVRHLLPEERITSVVRSRERGAPAATVRERRVRPTEIGRRLAGVDLWIRVGPATRSAAEAVAFSLQQSGRARVVGSPTAGAGSQVEYVRLPHGFGLGLPVSRLLDPTGTRGFEGTGVLPDLELPARASRATLLERLGRRRAGG